MNTPQPLESPTWERGALTPTGSRGDEILEAQHLEPQFPSPFLPPGYPHHLQPRHRAHRHALGVVPGAPLGPAMASGSFGCSFLAPPHHQQTPLHHHRSLSPAQTWSFTLQGHPRRDPSCGDRQDVSPPAGRDESHPTAPYGAVSGPGPRRTSRSRASSKSSSRAIS